MALGGLPGQEVIAADPAEFTVVVVMTGAQADTVAAAASAMMNGSMPAPDLTGDSFSKSWKYSEL